jgi:hypothetical protein
MSHGNGQPISQQDVQQAAVLLQQGPSLLKPAPTGPLNSMTPPGSLQRGPQPAGPLNNMLPLQGPLERGPQPGPLTTTAVPGGSLLPAAAPPAAGGAAPASGPSLAAQGAAGAVAAMQANAQGLPYAPAPLQAGGGGGGIDISKLLKFFGKGGGSGEQGGEDGASFAD